MSSSHILWVWKRSIGTSHTNKHKLTHLHLDKLTWLSASNHSRQKYFKSIRLSSNHQCTIKLIFMKQTKKWKKRMITINLQFHWHNSCCVVTAAFRNWNFSTYKSWPNLQGLDVYKQQWVNSHSELPCFVKMLCSLIWSIMSGICVTWWHCQLLASYRISFRLTNDYGASLEWQWQGKSICTCFS